MISRGAARKIRKASELEQIEMGKVSFGADLSENILSLNNMETKLDNGKKVDLGTCVGVESDGARAKGQKLGR